MMHKYVLEIISNLHLTENKKIMMIYNKLENNFIYYFHLFIFVFRTNSKKLQYATINICMALNFDISNALGKSDFKCKII